MKILFDNKARHPGVLISSIEKYRNANHPAHNVVDSFLEREFRSKEAEDIISFSFKKKITANCVFWGYHNLQNINFSMQDRGKRTIPGSDVGDDTVIQPLPVCVSADDVIPVPVTNPAQYGAVYSSLLVSRIAEFKVRVNAAVDEPYVWLGGIAIGEAYIMPDPVNTWGFSRSDNGIVSSSRSGQRLGNYVKPLRSHEFLFKGVSLKQTQEIMDRYDSVGMARHIWVDPFEAGHTLERPLYCTITKPIEPQKEDDTFSFILSIEEAR